MSIDIRQSADSASHVTQIGYQELHLVPIPRAWKPPAERDPRGLTARAVGRGVELAELHERLTQHGTAAITAAIAGQAAIGKSTLAALFARQYGAPAAYPGGVLWAQLDQTRTTTAACQPILDRWAAYAYEGDPQVVTQTFRQKSFVLQPDAVRALLSGHGPLLAIIDDAWEAAPVEHLRAALPDDARIILTTREQRLARDFGLQKLDALSEEDAQALLAARLPAADPALRTALMTALGRHPLALSIAADDLAARQPHEWAGLVERLAAEVAQGHSLGDLPLGDEARQSAVEAAFTLSYRAMPEVYQRRFRQLGVFAPPEADFSAEAAAAVWGDSDLAPARDALNVFFNRSLLEPTAQPDRWAQHAQLRSYALALLARADEATAAAERHLAFYQAQVDYWFGEHSEIERLRPELPQFQHAFRWASDQAPERLVSYVVDLWQWLLNANEFRTLDEWLQSAQETAAAHDDAQGLANTLKALGDLSLRTADLPAAQTYYDRARPLYEAIGDRLGLANTHTSLGDLLQAQGDSSKAVEHYQQAIALSQAIGDGYTKAMAQIYMGPALVALERYEEALGHGLEALVFYSARELAQPVQVVVHRLQQMKQQIGADTFAEVWQKVVGDSLPEWLAE